jgi:hypothetical protein
MHRLTPHIYPAHGRVYLQSLNNQEHLHAAVRTVVHRLGWQAIEHEEDASWTLLWMDCSIPVDRVMRLRVSQVGLHVSILHHPPAGCWCGSIEAQLRLTSRGSVVRACPQVVNHFYGMFELYRKKGLARSLAAMAAEAPDDYANLTP